MKTVRIGTRGSALALAQTGQVRAILADAWPELEFDLVIIRTTGDQLAPQPDQPLPLGKGLFTSELEQALLQEDIDVAVHSLKDLPTTFDSRLTVGAIPLRADARDVLVTRGELSMAALPSHPRVATGSQRRLSQLRQLRPDLVAVDIRGNIDTRLKKLHDHPEWNGLVLAAAGVDRLQPDTAGLTLVRLSPEEMLPAPGQGALALQVRGMDGRILEVVAKIEDHATRKAVAAERAFLGALGGGCEWPVGAWAEVREGVLNLRGIYWHGDEIEPRQGHLSGPLSAAEDLGRALAKQVRP